MQRQPEISVIIPVFNHEMFVEDCVRSASAQSLDDLEIICVDDGSTDTSLERLRRMQLADGRIKVLAQGTNQGVAKARNRGLSQARGRFVAFLDSDDLLLEHSLRHLRDLAVDTRSPMARGSMITRFADGSGQQGEWQKMPSRCAVALQDEPKLWLPWGFQCFLYSREFLAANQCAFPALVDGEDPVFLAQCLVNAGRISLSSEITYVYSRANTGGSRHTLAHLLDFIEHASLVKSIFTSSGHLSCWTEGVEPTYLGEMDARFENLSLDAAQQRAAVDRLRASPWNDEVRIGRWLARLRPTPATHG